MCGIAGIISLNGKPVAAERIKAACDIMSHRGPDDAGYLLLNYGAGKAGSEGFWREFGEEEFLRRYRDYPPLAPMDCFRSRAGENFHIALGHRRLSILDLSPAGHQPMSDPEKKVWITYNGETYNYPELKKNLQSRGHQFLSRTDTEALIHLYEEEGPDMVRGLNGIFAFALWDHNRRTLLLARDRYGVKPLYYAVENGVLVFASEIKGVLKGLGRRASLSLKGFNEYFTFQNTFGEQTLFEGINLLEAGTFLTWSQSGKTLKKIRYWDYDYRDGNGMDDKEFEVRVRNEIKSAVVRQLMSDVPLGIELSGGMDSGSISAIAVKKTPRIMTFTGGFDVSRASNLEAFFDERADAEFLASKLGTEHYEMVLHAGDMPWVMRNLIYHLEDLRVGMSYQNWYISRLASKFVKVILSGAGGDEIFAGYPWRYKLLAGCGSETEFERRYYNYWSRLISDRDKPEFFTPQIMEQLKGFNAIDSFKAVLKANPNRKSAPLLKKALYFEAKTFLHGLLVIGDKISMAHSLEQRVPLLDNKLVDISTAIPSRLLVDYANGNGNGNGNGGKFDENKAGKIIFRRAMRPLLPREIIEKRKQGFSPPEGSWYREYMMSYIRGLLLSKTSLARGYFQPKSVRRILAEHESGKTDHRLLIWSFVAFEWWNRLFIDNPI